MLTILNVILYGLPKVFTLLPTQLGQRGEFFILVQILYVLRWVQSFQVVFVFSCDEPIKLANCPNKRKKKKQRT
jgi:hypothetical protein